MRRLTDFESIYENVPDFRVYRAKKIIDLLFITYIKYLYLFQNK